MARKWCYLCPVRLDNGGIRFTYQYSPGALHKDEYVVDIYLCEDCAKFAKRVPDAMNAIIMSRYKDE